MRNQELTIGQRISLVDTLLNTIDFMGSEVREMRLWESDNNHFLNHHDRMSVWKEVDRVNEQRQQANELTGADHGTWVANNY